MYCQQAQLVYWFAVNSAVERSRDNNITVTNYELYDYNNSATLEGISSI